MPKVKVTPIRERRFVRPIDRQKMRPWLENHLDKKTVPGVRWVDTNRTIFEIPWRHAARHGWTLEKDAGIFEFWAIHTMRYVKGKEEEDPKRWKANFRCALNSLPDVERVLGTSSKGQMAVRRYKFLSTVETKRKSSKAKRSIAYKRRQSKSSYEHEEDMEEVFVQTCDDDSDDSEISSPTGLPNFDIILGTNAGVEGNQLQLVNHLSGCHLLQQADTPVPHTQVRSSSPNSVGGGSDSDISHYSDEETAGAQWEQDNDVLEYQPGIWAEIENIEFGIAASVELETTESEQVQTVIELQSPEHWELSSNGQCQ